MQNELNPRSSTVTRIADPAELAGVVTERPLPLRHPWQWISALLIVGLLILLAVGIGENHNFRFSAVPAYLFSPVIFEGLWVTIKLTVAAEFMGIIIGVLVAVVRTSGNPILRATGWSYVGFFRGTPVLVQLVFWFNLAILFRYVSFGIPGLFHISIPTNEVMTGFTAALLGLGLNEGAYMSEIVRAGLLAVDPGQTEAAKALGMTKLKTLRLIVLPQALRIIVPPTGNQLISMLKTTSLVSVVAGGDLLTRAENLYSSNFLVLELLVVASIWYLVLTSVASVGQSYIERRLARSTAITTPAGKTGGKRRLRKDMVARGETK